MENEFEIYDRISDKIMYLGNTAVLDFVVMLSSKAKDGSRRHFHSESEKTSTYIGTQTSRSITRNIRFFFSINDRENFTNNFVMNPADVAMIKRLMDIKVFPWYFDKRIYDVIDNRLVITGKYEPAYYTKSEYKYLRFDPIVCEYQTGQFKEGVRVCFNTNDSYFDLTLDDLFGFYYILTNTSMYNLAAEMVNYVKSPPYGINKTEYRGLGSGGAMYDQPYNKPTRSGADFLNNK